MPTKIFISRVICIEGSLKEARSVFWRGLTRIAMIRLTVTLMWTRNGFTHDAEIV